MCVLARDSGIVTHESISSAGTQPDGDSQEASLSADGRVIAFETIASNLLTRPTRIGLRHVIVRDRESGQPALSGNGLVPAFTSDAQNIVAGPDANRRETDILLWRLDASTIVRVSVDATGVQPSEGGSHSPSISHDGRTVA